MPAVPGSTVLGAGALRTEGRMPMGEKEVSLDAPAMGSQSLDGLQRALEVELVDF